MAKNQIVNVDFSDVKDSTGINPKHKPEGEYLLKISKAEVTKTKNDEPMVLFLLQATDDRSAVYPYYCPLTPASLWKIRTLFINLGLPVPKSKGKLNVGSTEGREIGVALEDDEYNGKMKSVIVNTFPANELEAVDSESDDEDYEDDVEEEEEEEAPKAKKRKAAPVVEEDEDDEEEDEEEEEAPVVKKPSARTLKRRAEKAAAEKAALEAEEDEDDEEEEEEVPVKKTRKKKPAPVEEDEDDDLDLDDI